MRATFVTVAGYGYDAKRGLLVVQRDHEGSDEEYATFLERIAALDRDAAAAGVAPVFVIVLSTESPAPNAHWRRKFAEAASSAVCPNTFGAIVTDSAVQRGVLNAIGWLQPYQRGHALAFKSFAQAVNAAEKHREEALPELRTLLHAAQEDLVERRGVAHPGA